MTISKARVQKSFGQNAITYDQYAVVQKEMAMELLEKIKSTDHRFQNILEIGCGTGFLTELLATEYPKAQITATDIAPEMLTAASKKFADFSNIKYLALDGENLRANKAISDQTFDLIVSNAAFQWFTEYTDTFTQYHNYLKSGGYLIFSTFGAGTFRELYSCLFKEQAKNREPFIDKGWLRRSIAEAGFELYDIEESTKIEYFKSCRDFLKAIKMIGAHHYLTDQLTGQGLGSGIFSLIKNYDADFLEERGVPATYKCLFGWGRRTT